MMTILFSTFNGMQTLPRMLTQLQSIKHPDGLRIVAVDNRSTDGSGAFLRQWQDKLPITVLDFPQPGKNRALNFALDQIADGLDERELVVITDDDIVPDNDWLLQLSRSAQVHRDVSAFGGVIKPLWPDNVPSWLNCLESEYAALFATTSARHGTCSSRDIYGPNMAVRARLFKRGLRFNGAIGPDGSQSFGMGSESELLRRIERMGHRMFFCEHAIVGHQVKPSLLRWSAVLRRGQRYGRGLGMMDRQHGSETMQMAHTLAQLFVLELKALATWMPRWSSRRPVILYRREVRLGRLLSYFAAPIDKKLSTDALADLAMRLRQLSAQAQKIVPRAEAQTRRA